MTTREGTTGSSTGNNNNNNTTTATTNNTTTLLQQCMTVSGGGVVDKLLVRPGIQLLLQQQTEDNGGIQKPIQTENYFSSSPALTQSTTTTTTTTSSTNTNTTQEIFVNNITSSTITKTTTAPTFTLSTTTTPDTVVASENDSHKPELNLNGHSQHYISINNNHNNNNIITKITDKHLSNKIVRSASAPYILRNPNNNTTTNQIINNNNHINNNNNNKKLLFQQQLNHLIEEEQQQQDSKNSVMVNTTIHQQQQQQQQSNTTTTTHPNNTLPNIKHETNGNNIEIQLIDNGNLTTTTTTTGIILQNGSNDVGMIDLSDQCYNNNSNNSSSGIVGPYNNTSSSIVVVGGGGGGSSSVCSGSCGGSITDNLSSSFSTTSTTTMSTGGSSGLNGSNNGNGMCGQSLTQSPGGSLDEHDCDDEKVINGDTFTPGDVPDPDAIKMFVGQVPKHLSEGELKMLFEEFGRVFQINVLRDKVTKQSKGCCFVTFYSRKSALEAQNALHNIKTLPGMNHPIQMKPADNENRYERKLFLGMLSKKCNESDVRNMFSRYGHIDECTVLRDPHGQSRGCAFITFASKQCAQSAIKALHHSITMEGCTSPIVVKFADTQKDKDQKRNQQIQVSMMNNLTTTGMTPIAPQYFSELLVEQILQQLQAQQQQQQQQQVQQQQQQQQQQQHQTNSYFSQLTPLSGVPGIGSLAGFGSSPTANGLSGLGGPHSSANNDLATLAALANFTGITSNQHSVALGVQAALVAAMGGTNSALSPSEFNYSGANGNSMGSTNSLAGFTGNGLHQGLSSYTSALRSSMVVNKQAEGPEGANLFIYHLPPECADPDLISMFTPFGTVISAKVFIDKNTNLSKCFGFVSYDNAVSAQLAIQAMNGFQVGMKRLKVQLKRSKDAAKPY